MNTRDSHITVRQLVVGTAGHIDHGKSRLVMALTGVDPDRLPEEQARGMTIDLGFGHCRWDDCDIWFVDVPGHERFIRNMVAGATGVDVALLVVAADDSVMPQTREHAEVLSLLGVQRCIVAVSKIDLVDADLAELVEEEVRELLASLEIEPAAIVWTSAQTGAGLAELRAALLAQAGGGGDEGESPRGSGGHSGQTGGQSPPYGWFRLPIDRAFNIAGRGTVVTGSVAHGAVQRDAELELWPPGRRVRVRDIQTHFEGMTAVAGRMRLALNLAGIGLDEVERGCELGTPGCLEATQRVDVWVSSLRMPGKRRRENIRLRLHIATSDVLAELRLLEMPADLVIRGQFGQLRIAEPIVATWGQRFILRDESGSRTLGGGLVLRPAAQAWTTKRPARLDGLTTLRTGTPKQRVEEVVRDAEWDDVPAPLLATRAGVRDGEEYRELQGRLGTEGRVQRMSVGAGEAYLHRDLLEDFTAGVTERLKKFMSANPRLPGVARREWPAWMPKRCGEKLRPALAEWLIEAERVGLANGYVVPPGHASAMSKADEQLLAAVLAELEAGAFQPPAPKSLQCVSAKDAKRAQQLIDLAAARGELKRIHDDIWLTAPRHAELIETVRGAIRERGGMTVGDLRTLLNSSRKFIVPLIEHLDAIGVTRRVGDERVLKEP